jgi:hypothetical protein
MEKYNSPNQRSGGIFNLEIDENAKSNFLDMARWTKFLAILGLVVQGLVLCLGVFLSLFLTNIAETYGGPSASAIANMGALGPIAIVVFFLVIIGINIYPIYALLRYSACIKIAINTDNKEQFNRAIKYLKWMFKYIGVLAIITLVIYGLEILFAIIAGIAR